MDYPGQGSITQSNVWAGIRSYAARGGLVNGLNPNVVGKTWYVNANSTVNNALKRGPIGGNGNTGQSPLTPFATLARAFEFVQSYDTIVIDGVIREQLVTPTDVYNVTIIGGGNLTPRQATSGGVPTGGGASWLPPSTGAVAATPLLEIKSAGWSLINVQMSPHTASACVRLTRSASVDTIDASHARFENCYFSGGGTTPIGIEDNGGSSFVQVLGCRFQNLTSAILSLTTAADVPLSWNIQGNRFQQNTNDIKMSLNYAQIQWNNFLTAGAGATNKVVQTNFLSAQGNNNHVCHNVFTNAAAAIANASGYNGGNADVWADNYATDAVDYGIPA